MNNFLLIDGSSIFYRSFYGLAPLHNSKGQPTQAILGFLRTLQKLIKNYSNFSIIIAWDAGTSGRNIDFVDYKSSREKPPQELIDQKKILMEILEQIGVRQVIVNGFEADDILFQISQNLLSLNVEKIILVSSDKDLLQLVGEKVFVLDPFKDVLFDAIAINQKFGFGPEKILFYFSLLGDSSDEIPGVDGIGKVSATKIVQNFSSLEDLYARLSDVDSPKLREKLELGRANAFLSATLFSLRPVILENNLIDNNLVLDGKSLDWEKAFPIFVELELKTLLPKNWAEPVLQNNKEQILPKILLVQKLDDFKKIVDLVYAKKIVAIDLETTGFSWLNDQIVGISFAIDSNVFYVPFLHQNLFFQRIENQLNFFDVEKNLKLILQDNKILKIFHNAKFDLHFLKKAILGLSIENVYDTAIAARLTMPEWFSIGLKSLSQSLLFMPREDLVSILKKYGPDFRSLPLDIATSYAGQDAWQTFQLYQIFNKKFEDEADIFRLFQDVEMPLFNLLLKMEERGIFLDEEKMLQISKNVDQKINVIVGKINSFLEEYFPDQINLNLNSPKQLQVFLFQILKLQPQKKTSGKTYSTDVEVLEELAKVHPFPELILQYRKLIKIKSTYLDSLLSNRSSLTGAVHTDFSQIIVATGRLSSNNPNLQNIPNIWENINVRSAFVPRPGKVLISADYSQIELRILAKVSEDLHLQQIFLSGGDVHLETAIKIFGKNDISDKERSVAKRINFSILYGLSAFSLAKEMDISVGDAKKYIELFFSGYPGVQIWMDKVLERAKIDGFVTTLWGRKRWFRNLNDSNSLIAKAEARAAINAIIQGSAADLMKIAMIEVDRFLTYNKIQAEILLQVHDEILIESDEVLANDLIFNLSLKFANIVTWPIPLIANFKLGKNWGNLTKTE